MTTYYPLHKLRKIEGLEKAKFVDPYAGSKGNSIRYLSVAPRNNDMQVIGVNNLFCGGEKSGLFVGHTEAIATGTLAGHNAVRMILGIPLLQLPRSLSVGDIIAFANESLILNKGKQKRYTFAGSLYFQRMKNNNLYSINIKEIEDRVKKVGLENIFNLKLI